MLPPRAQNYHFAYSILPQMMFRSDGASICAAMYPESYRLFDVYWERFGGQMPAEERVPNGVLKYSAHKLGGKDLALVIELPPPERALEAIAIAFIFRPDLRYFVLGKAPSFEPDDVHTGLPRATLREVTPTLNARVTGVFETSVATFLDAICKHLELPSQIEDATDLDFQAMAPHVPFYDPLPASGSKCAAEEAEYEARLQAQRVGAANPGRAWWQFWKA